MALNILKNHSQENRTFNARLSLGSFIICALLATLSVRCFYLQVLKHQLYTTLSDKNRLTLIPIVPTRGLIFDRNGILVAENLPTFSLQVKPAFVIDLDLRLAELSNLISLSPEEIESFAQRMKRSRAVNATILKANLSEKEIALFSVKQHLFPGFSIEANFIRGYPFDYALSHVLGYVGRISERDLNQIDTTNYSGTSHIGKNGLEHFYEKELHGTVGYQQVETDAKGNIVRKLSDKPQIPGKNLYLTIDAKLQQAAYKAMGKNRGAVVAVNPKNGEVLVMISTPGFNPNLFVNGITSGTYKELNQSRSKPLFNRAIQGQYPPGSIVKPVVALAGLETHAILPNTKIYCPGWFKLHNDEHLFRDWKKTGHGWVDLNSAIAESCDTYFYKLSHKLTIEVLSPWLEKASFGKKTNIDLPGEVSGLVPSKEWKKRVKQENWYTGETLSCGIGQSFLLATPVQMAHYSAMLANRGQPVQLHLVKQYNAVNGSAAETIITSTVEQKPLAKFELNEQKNWDYIIQAMHSAAQSPKGTAYTIMHRLPYSIAGKTGTSQVFSIKQNESYNKFTVEEYLRDHSIFIAFSPVEDPEIALAVLVENNSDSQLVAKELINFYMKNKTHAQK